MLGRTPTSDNILYSKGQRVWVKKETSGGLRWRKPHLRVPGYLFGCSGTVERVCGVFSNPEGKVFGVDAKQPLYRVRFRMEDIWMAYRGEPGDTCDAEVYQHWLQPEPLCQDPQAKRPCVRKADDETSKGVEGHSHVDGGDDGHTHEPRPDVEQVAVDKEGEETPSQRLGEAFCRVVISKGLLTAEEIRAGVEAMDRHEASLAGPRIVAKAWADPAFKELLLKDASAACAQIGVNPSNSTAPTVLTAVENTTEVHNLVVCTLCSCYPRSILGSSPDWYKSRSYRARAVLEPRAVLEEFGMFLPPGLRIRVHDSTADLRYFVLPRRPDGTEGWAEEQLAKLVTKDSMIGAAEPLRPSRSA